MRRVFALRRALLPLAVPYLGVACLALLALAGSYAFSAGLGDLAGAYASPNASPAQLSAAAPTQVALSETHSASPRVLSATQHAVSAWQVQARVARRADIAVWNAATKAATAQTRALLVAVALARAH